MDVGRKKKLNTVCKVALLAGCALVILPAVVLSTFSPWAEAIVVETDVWLKWRLQ